MPNVRLAGRYAKSLLDLAIEQNQLDAVHADMKYFQAVCAQSPDFVNVLRVLEKRLNSDRGSQKRRMQKKVLQSPFV